MSRSMQNNFRVYCNGEKIFSECEDTPSKDDCRTILGQLFPNDHNTSDRDAGDEPRMLPQSNPWSVLLDVITKTVSEVLYKEPLLQNMKRIQQLDVIDGDGAVMVYERLVQLCEGSNTEADKLLDDVSLIPCHDALPERMRGTGLPMDAVCDYQREIAYLSLYPFPECISLNRLLDETAKFQKHLHEQIMREERMSPDEEIMNAYHANCIESVNHLSKEACICLLQNWLLSLSLCDVSFFVTFRLSFPGTGCEVSEEPQSSDRGGIVFCSLQDGTSAECSPAVHSEIKLVDCDPRPAKKLHSRRKAEGKYGLITNNIMN